GKRPGRPPTAHPRDAGLFIRFSDVEWAALERARAKEFPVPSRRPAVAAWLRELAVGHASAVLGVHVTRSGIRADEGGAPNWQRWRLAKAVQRAARKRRKTR